MNLAPARVGVLSLILSCREGLLSLYVRPIRGGHVRSAEDQNAVEILENAPRDVRKYHLL